MRAIIAATLCLAVFPAWSTAQTSGIADVTELTAADRQSLERLALARARAALHDRIRALPLGDNLTIGDWAVGDVHLDRALRAWTRSRPRYAVPRHYTDGACDLDIRVVPAVLRDQILTWRTEFKRQSPTQAVARRAAQRWPVLWQTGSAQRSEAPIGNKPPGWENIGFDGVQLARRAARTDAGLALLKEAARLKLNNARRLADFLDSNDAVREAVLSAIQQSARLDVRSEPDQVAVASATIAIPDLIRILTDVHTAHYKGDLFHAADFREMALLARQNELRATGLGIPPRSSRTQPKYRTIELDRPPWTTKTLRAKGRYEPSDDDGKLDEAVRIQIARLDAMDALRRQVEALVVQNDVTISQLLGEARELKSDVVVFLTGARLLGATSVSADGTLEARVELPLARLWTIVRRGMTLVEVDPPDEKPAP